jgi:eukaryotic-like serine/threonine-protein kinase
METFKRLVREIHRRSLWQVVGIYLVGAWFGYQVTLGLTDGLGLPNWVPPLAFILFIVGLPIVTATAFIQEGGPAGGTFRPGARGDDDPDRALDPNSLVDRPPAARVDPVGDADRAVATILTWPRAFLAGVLAFALLGAGTAGWMGMRALGVGPVGSLVAAGAIEDQERILIADFAGPPDLRETARVVKDALEIDFARSTLVRLVGSSEIRDVLRRMDRDGEVEVHGDLAREVALRAGVNVFLTGEVAPLGSGYIISIRLVSAATGETLLPSRETARDLEDLIPAVDRLSRHLRERTGESLRTIRRAPPLEQVTTSSLEALRKYTEGRRAQLSDADQARALGLFEEAVAQDSAFASAWRGIAVIRSNWGQPEAAQAAVGHALRFQDRLTDKERHLTVALDHSIRGESRPAIAAYERVLALDSLDGTALNNIGVQYRNLDDLSRAEAFFRRALATDSTRILILENLSSVLHPLERFEEFRELSELAVARHPEVVLSRVWLAGLPAAHGDYRAAEGALRAIVEDPGSGQRLLTVAGSHLMGALAVQGRLGEADEVRRAAFGPHPLGEDFAGLERRFQILVTHHERPEEARPLLRELEGLVEERAADDEFRFGGLAMMCVAVGDGPCARRHLERSGLADPPGPHSPSWHHRIHGQVAGAEGDVPAAIRHLRASNTVYCRNCFETTVGMLHERNGDPAAAIASYERFLASQSTQRLRDQEWEVPLVHIRLARLYEETGDLEAARRHHAHLIELWENADPELQYRVEAARRALARLEANGS